MGNKRTLMFILFLLAAAVFFVLSSQPADAKIEYNPSEILMGNPITKTFRGFYSSITALSSSSLRTHVECGGGDQTKIDLGPVLDNISSCDTCKNIAQCLTNKHGVAGAGVGYLWDAHTDQCGIGIDVPESEARACVEEDTCLGVDVERFNEIKDNALAAVNAAPAFYDPKFIPNAETLLALSWVESRWNNFDGSGAYPGDMCAQDKTAVENLCSDPFREDEIKLMDIDGNGSPDNTSCLSMPVSADPDGAGPFCGGKMGIGQIWPSVYYDRIISSSFASAGELHPNPWDIRDGFFAAEELLAYENKTIYESCFTACMATGTPLSECQTTCTDTMNENAIRNYHFGTGSGATEAEKQAFFDEVEKFKPVMKSLLDTGTCTGGPVPGGPIPTPCPPESAGEATLISYISDTFNIHFDGAWSAGGLYDVCTKLYETSGTRFDDFFVNDPDGATVAADGGGGFCSVSGKKVSCDPGMPLIDSRGEIFTFVIFHELGHTLKSLNPAAAREADIDSIARFEYNLHLGETTTPWLFDNTRHISKYPYGLNAGTCPIASSWPSEEYAETVGYYFHPGTGEIMLPAGACMGGDSYKPYVNADHKAPEHCNLMYDVMGAYNPACAETLGIWQIHSNICDATDAGSCQARLMLQFFDMHAADAVQICRRESGGNALALNDNCLTGTTSDYSIGLFQINLLAHCEDEDGDGTSPFFISDPFCTITDQDDVDICKKKFGYGDPVTNTAKALEIALAWGGFGSGGTGWDPWSTADACGLMPHP